MTAPSPRPRGEYAKTPARRQDILAAAIEVFAAAGFHKGALRDVAERAGLSQAGLLHHYPSKNHLLEAVLTWRDEESMRQFINGRDDGLAKVRGLVELAQYNQEKTPELVELFTLLSAEATAADHPVHDYFAGRYRFVLGHLRESFEELASTGELREGIDPASAARSLVALMDGLQIQWLYDRDSVDMAAEVRTYVQSLLTVEL